MSRLVALNGLNPLLQISQWRPSVPFSLIRNKRDPNIYLYLYDHSSSDKEIDGRGPGRGEKADEEAFEDDGSMPRRAILFHHHRVVVFCFT